MWAVEFSIRVAKRRNPCRVGSNATKRAREFFRMSEKKKKNTAPFGVKTRVRVYACERVTCVGAYVCTCVCVRACVFFSFNFCPPVFFFFLPADPSLLRQTPRTFSSPLRSKYTVVVRVWSILYWPSGQSVNSIIFSIIIRLTAPRTVRTEYDDIDDRVGTEEKKNEKIVRIIVIKKKKKG